jgi:hypothetical protein
LCLRLPTPRSAGLLSTKQYKASRLWASVLGNF